MFDLDGLLFFTENNIFTGICRRGDKPGEIMRYRVAPDIENQKLLAATWHEDKCYERMTVPPSHEASFPLSEEGLEQIQEWLLGIWPDPHWEILSEEFRPNMGPEDDELEEG